MVAKGLGFRVCSYNCTPFLHSLLTKGKRDGGRGRSSRCLPWLWFHADSVGSCRRRKRPVFREIRCRQCRVEPSGLKGLGFRVEGLGLRVLRELGLRFLFRDLGCGVWSLSFIYWA